MALLFLLWLKNWPFDPLILDQGEVFLALLTSCSSVNMGIGTCWEVNIIKLSVSSGISQGSVLGPILFAIFIKDLPDGLISAFKIFADDTKLIATILRKNILEDWVKLQEDADKISEWYSQ